MGYLKVVHKDRYKGGIGSDDLLGSISDSANITLDNLAGVRVSNIYSGEQIVANTQIVAAQPNTSGWTDFIAGDGSFGNDGTGYLYTNLASWENAGLTYKTNTSFNTGAILGDFMMGIGTNQSTIIDKNNANIYRYENNVADMTAWTKGATRSGTTSCTIDPSAARSNLTKSLTLNSGQTYKIRVTLSAGFVGNLVVKRGATTVGTITKPTTTYSTNPSSYAFFFTAPASETRNLSLEPATGFGGTITYTEIRYIMTDYIKTLAIGGDVCLVDSPYVYVANGNVLKGVKLGGDISGLVVEDFMTLPVWEKIIGMTISGQYINIYTVGGGSTSKYIWDKVSEFPQEKMKRDGKIATSVSGNGNADYLLIDGSLYISSGYQLEKIIDKKQAFSMIPNDRVFEGLGGFINDKLIITGKDGFLQTPCIYTYGSTKAGLDKVLVKEQIFTAGFSGYYPNQVRAIGPGLFSTYYFLIEPNRYGYNTMGYFTDNPVTFGLTGDIKTQNRIRIGGYLSIGKTNTAAAYDPATGEFSGIRVYCAINDSHYTTVGMYDNKETPPSVGDIYTNTTARGTYTIKVIRVEKRYGQVYVTFTNDATHEIIYKWGGVVYTKVSGSGPDTFTGGYYDNFMLLKTIERDKPGYFNELIGNKEFGAINAPAIYKLQLKVEIGHKTYDMQTSMITDIVYIADIVQDDTN